MSQYFEGRPSDSPYVEMIWRGQAGSDYFPVCPADVRWNMLLLRHNDRVKVSIEGPLTRARPTRQPEGAEWLVIKFKLGAFMPHLPVRTLLDAEAVLPKGAHKSFWLKGATWQLPDFENVETFVSHLVRDELLLRDPLVSAVLQDQPQSMSFRTVRRRFLMATGLTPKLIQQIDRAQQAAAILAQGVPIIEAAYQAGYADQPHMTRSLKHFIGHTPAQIARENVLA
jgi:AraC-like DNA-binding protein